MLVDTISKVNNITFDSTNLSAYVTSLRGLSETQARVVLSSTSLDKVQKQQILNKIAETNATVSLTSAEATEALTRSLGSKEAANELLVKSGLVTEEQLLAGTTIEVTSAKIADAVATGVLTKEEGLKISTALGLTGANIGLGTSFKLLAKSIWQATVAMVKWLFLTPAGWATLAITAIVGATAAYIKWGDTLDNTREKLADLKSEYDTVTSDIESVNGELETTKKRISELENKGKLTFTEKEELDNLIKQNNELQRTIDLLKLEQDEKQKEKNKTFVSAMEKDVEQHDEYHVSSYSGKVEKGHGGRDIGMGTNEKAYINQQFRDYQENLRQISELNEQYKDDLSNKEYQKEKKRLEDKNKKISKYINDKNKEFTTDAEGIDYIQNPTTEDDKKVNEWLDYINDFQDKMAVAMGGENAKENAFNRLVDNWKFDEALNPLQKLGKEGKVTLDELKKRMSDPVFAEFVDKLVEIGVISDTTDGSLRYLANAFNGTATSARNYVTALKGNDLNNFIKNLDEEAKALGTTESELAKLTAAHVIFNNTGLSTEQQQQALQMLAAKIATTSAEMKYLLQLFNYASGNFDAAGASTMTEQERRARTVRSKQYLKDKYGIDLSPIKIPEKEDTPPYTPSGGDDKGSSKDNTPDYEDPTEAIINRINLRSKELEQQEEQIENAIEIAELENDYKKQISLINDLIAKRKDRLAELETANAGLHNEAEYLRNVNPWDEATWFDSQGNATEAYNALYNSSSKEEQERIKDLFESLSKYKKAYMDNVEEIVGLNKQILQDEEKIWDLRREEFDARMEESEYYIEHSKDFGWENGDNEVKARKRVLEWIQSDYYKSLIKDDVEYYKILEENRLKYIDAVKDEVNEILDFNKSRIESQKTLLQSYYDVSNSVAEAQHEINKEFAASLTMSEYLDEKTKDLLFNQKDYNILSDKLVDIQAEADKLQRKYNQDILSATADNLDEITSKYQMQYDLMMKQYEIAKAELEVAKKRQQLDNVLNERNVRMFINGQWQWVADTQNVIDAQNELADAKFEAQQALVHKEQTESMNELTSATDKFTTIMNKIDSGAIDLRDGIGDITSSLKKVSDESVPALENVLDETKAALRNFASSLGNSKSSSSSNDSYTSSGSNNSSSKPKANATATIPGLGTVGVHIDSSGKTTTSGLPSGTVVHTGGGDYKITGGSGGKYTSVKVKNKYASGTGNTNAGDTLIGEKEPEIYIDNDGHLIPVVQPTIFKNIEAGGKVFNNIQMRNLESLWNWSNVGFNHSLPAMVERNQSVSSVDNSIHINGITISEQGNEDWISGLKRYVYTHKGSM